MAGLIRRSDIDEVRSRVNIADVVGGYVTLKSAGVGSLKGLCPFHDERSPSFHVRPQVGRYHCFGCGEDGDVFSFLQRMDHCTFSEAVERLASGIGYQLRYEDGGAASSGVEAGARARILAANAAAAEFFVAQLSEPAAEPGRIFLGQRGFDPAAAQRFGVGFAPKSYTALVTHMATVGFSAEECLAAGLVGQGERGTYDRFRGRLVWPIRDVTGQTIGFGARKLLDDDTGPKYLNTPETAVYRKSQVLYGLDMAKRDISRNKQVVVVEGYTDVMACHLAGVTTAVATCGTAFGVDHIKLVRRVLGDFGAADARGLGEVVFTFDPDEAGQRAASRAFEEEQRFAAQTFVAVAPGGLDPCDLRLKRGDAAVRDMVARKKPMSEFMIRRVLAQYDLETVEGRVSALRASAPVVADIRDQSLSGGYVRTLAGWLGVDPGEVARAVSAARARGEAQPGRGAAAGGRPGTSHGAAGTPLHAGMAEEPVLAPPMLAQLPNDPVTRLERDALMAMVQQPEKVGVELLRSAAHTRFASESLAVVRDAIAGRVDEASSPTWLDGLIDDVPAPFATLVKELGVAPLPERSSREIDSYCRGVVKSLVERDLLRRKAELLGVLQRVDAVADAERYRATQSELVEVERQRRELQREDEI